MMTETTDPSHQQEATPRTAIGGKVPLKEAGVSQKTRLKGMCQENLTVETPA